MIELAPIEIIIALLLDTLIGDPRWLPHPVRAMGFAIVYGEALLRLVLPERDFLAGLLLTVGVAGGTAVLTYFIVELLKTAPPEGPLHIASRAALIYLLFTSIAIRGLLSGAAAVLVMLKGGDLGTARSILSHLVGRDTQNMDGPAVLRATIETVAENLSDGIVAPLFWFAVGGLPAALCYKAINTLDSMIGYRSEKYERFGKAAAVLDDIVNYIPARLTGLLLVLARLLAPPGGINRRGSAGGALNIMLRDGKKHPSPNAGVPEAAMAGALGITLGGPSTYGGRVVEKPWLGEVEGSGGEPSVMLARAALHLTAVVSFFSWFLVLLVASWLGGYIG